MTLVESLRSFAEMRRNCSITEIEILCKRAANRIEHLEGQCASREAEIVRLEARIPTFEDF